MCSHFTISTFSTSPPTPPIHVDQSVTYVPPIWSHFTISTSFTSPPTPPRSTDAVNLALYGGTQHVYLQRQRSHVGYNIKKQKVWYKQTKLSVFGTTCYPPNLYNNLKAKYKGSWRAKVVKTLPSTIQHELQPLVFEYYSHGVPEILKMHSFSQQCRMVAFKLWG